MLINRLKLVGFKSFVEPTQLRVEPGLTGVVGPNGCGKSNLLEAIRWVMGESSPKSMRGAGMEDVIFAGTQARPARDFAEVVLQGRTSDGEELDVTRRIERGSGSAYRVNGSDVRAKDVALTFADAATGAHSPALVSQGKIAQVIAAKPTERRQMLEEAAGISGLHVRRRDAEGKLRQTEANLTRLEDLMAGLDSQIASLKRQAKQAERYKSLSNDIQMAEARLLFARWGDAANAAREARSAAEQAETQVTNAKTAANAAQDAQHAAASRLASLREDRADRRDDASAHGHRMSALAQQLSNAEDRLADLDRQKERLETDRGDADRLTRDAAEALSRLERELASNERALETATASRPGLARAAEAADAEAGKAELALAKAAADFAGVEAEWRVADAGIEQARSALARTGGEARRIADAHAQISGAPDPAKAAREASIAVKQAAESLSNLRAKLETQRGDRARLQAARDDAASALAAAKAELHGAERECSALQKDKAARERQSRNDDGQPRVLDIIRAEPGYERALAAVLGRDAKAFVGHPANGRDGRFWTGRTAPAQVPRPLSNHVPESPPQLAARLALVHMAETDDGRDLAPGEWLVTPDGHLRRWDGFIARGEGAAEAARLEAENRLADLTALLPNLQSTAQDAGEAQRSSAQALTQLQQSLVQSERAVHDAGDVERLAIRALDQANAAQERAAARLAELQRAQDNLDQQRAAAQQTLTDVEAAKNSLPDPAAGRATLQAAKDRSENARNALQSAAARLAAHDQELAVAQERTTAQRRDIAGWQARSGDAAKRLSDTALRLEEIEEERAVVAAKPEGLHRQIAEGDTVRARLAAQLSAAERAAEEAQTLATAADRAFSEANEALATAREARAGLSARAESDENRRAEMARISGERFQCPPPMLAEKFGFDGETVRNAGLESQDLERLTASRERIGPVNLVATQELEKLEGEHGSSAEEQAELHEAVNRLRSSIGSLNREGRERLKSAFDQVDEHFRRLFSRLFEGGQAHLALIDSDDPLEAGLEIYAQPPGKRLQSLTLLSGGEQALTAVALIFALFLTNPAPICVLDEVDAPLDDANIDRFCDLLDAMTLETQTRYLIVTHNAVTMSRMHRLFGVTMTEPGISRLVSVDLGAAEELVAAQ